MFSMPSTERIALLLPGGIFPAGTVIVFSCSEKSSFFHNKFTPKKNSRTAAATDIYFNRLTFWLTVISCNLLFSSTKFSKKTSSSMTSSSDCKERYHSSTIAFSGPVHWPRRYFLRRCCALFSDKFSTLYSIYYPYDG